MNECAQRFLDDPALYREVEGYFSRMFGAGGGPQQPDVTSYVRAMIGVLKTHAAKSGVYSFADQTFASDGTYDPEATPPEPPCTCVELGDYGEHYVGCPATPEPINDEHSTACLHRMAEATPPEPGLSAYARLVVNGDDIDVALYHSDPVYHGIVRRIHRGTPRLTEAEEAPR
jgi:hypothetical protein